MKRDLYESRGVRWYAIIDPDEGQSALLRLDERGRYESLSAGGRHDVDLCPDCVLSLDLGG